MPVGYHGGIYDYVPPGFESHRQHFQRSAELKSFQLLKAVISTGGGGIYRLWVCGGPLRWLGHSAASKRAEPLRDPGWSAGGRTGTKKSKERSMNEVLGGDSNDLKREGSLNSTVKATKTGLHLSLIHI